jgi:hypothetical protein
MRQALSDWFNEKGRRSDDMGNHDRALRYYQLACRIDPNWSVPWYNLGLISKNRGLWQDSLRYNLRATDIDASNGAAWWNLGIAATALHDWQVARRAWRAYGLEVEDGSGEVSMPAGTACVRLSPNDSGEVVWGQRLDPARFVVLNVPLPESNHRFRDVVLNDGATNGTRVSSREPLTKRYDWT